MEEKLNKINCLTETCSKVFIQLQWPITSCVWTTVTATSHLHLALPIHSSKSSQRDPLNKTAHLIPMLKKPSVISHHPSNKIHKPFHKMYVFTESCLPLQSHPSPVFPWVTLLKSSGLLSVFFFKETKLFPSVCPCCYLFSESVPWSLWGQLLSYASQFQMLPPQRGHLWSHYLFMCLLDDL